MPRFIKLRFRPSDTVSACSLSALGRKFSSLTSFMLALHVAVQHPCQLLQEYRSLFVSKYRTGVADE